MLRLLRIRTLLNIKKINVSCQLCIRNKYKFAPYFRENLEAISVYCDLRDYILHCLEETNDVEQIEETVSHHTKFANKFTKEFRHWLIMFCYDHEITNMPVIIDAWEHFPSYLQFLLQTEEK